jgi:hypothetical protein
MDPMVGINHELGARGERERALGILRELHARPIPHAAFVAALIVGYPQGCQRVTLPAGDRLDCAGLAR